jgi:hypothetical protein
LELKCIGETQDDSPWPQSTTLNHVLTLSDLAENPVDMMERLLTVLCEKNILDVRDIDRIVSLPSKTIVPADYEPGGDYNPYSPR